MALYEHLNWGKQTSSDPAADGTENSLTTTEDFVLRGFSAALVTDSNAANRQVHVKVLDPDSVEIFRCTAGGTQAQSLTRQYTGVCSAMDAPAADDTNFVMVLPPDGVFVPSGSTISTVTTSSQATDNWGPLTVRFTRK